MGCPSAVPLTIASAGLTRGTVVDGFARNSARDRRAAAFAVSLAALAATMGGCAAPGLERSMALAGVPGEPAGFDAARREPLNARAHLTTGLALMERAGRTRADVELAKSAFGTAGRLAPDLWEPMAALAAAHYRLGEYREALAALSEAAERRGGLGDLALPYALAAYRAQEPELARLAFRQAEAAGGEAPFLRQAFAGGEAWRPQPAPAARQPVAADEERNILIEAFLIRDTRSANFNEGVNLLESLALQFEGTLVNYSYGGEDDGTDGQVTVTLPAVTYSLNLASRDLSRVSLEASPVVLARQGKTSKFLEGGSVLIVPLSDDSDPVERDVGISLEVTPERIGEHDVDLTVALELSNITGQSVNNAGRGASLLQTDKSRVEASARVPFGKAVVVGSTGSLTRRKTRTGSLTAAPVPGLSTKGRGASRRDVLALISVRRAEDDSGPAFDAAAVAGRLFGEVLPAPAAYGARPSDTPDPGLEALVARGRR